MKLSIITINLNNKDGLLRTLASVESQIDRQFEHVIVDGASTDGSVEVIKEYAERHDNVRWISEPDTGIYNAMNKAARMATADYLLYINSGDELYASDVVGKFNDIGEDGDMILGEEMSIHEEENRKAKLKHKCYEDHSPTLLTIYSSMEPLHQAAFIKRKLQLEVPYDETYRIAGDYHFYIKNILNNDCKICTVDLCVSNYYCGGISSFPENTVPEVRRVNKELLPKRIMMDYEGLTIEGVQLLKRLSKYVGFRVFVIKFTNRLVSCYSAYRRIMKFVFRQK